MEYLLLGPLEVRRDSEVVALPTGAVRTLLAVLLLERGEIVPAGRLVEELWNGDQPATAHKVVQVRISQLRGLLGETAIETRGRGYRLATRSDDVDADRFLALVDRGRAEVSAGRADDALALYDEALALWRGDALADVDLSLGARTDAERLDDRRLEAVEERNELMLASGREGEILGDLEALTAAQPLREKPWRQLMLALYRAGRQADALAAYERARRALDEVGLQPSERLRRLQLAILRQDPGLETLRPDPPSADRVPSARRPRRWLAVAAIAILVAIAGGLALERAGESQPEALLGVPPNSVGIIDPARNAFVAAIPVGVRPTAIAVDGTSIWVLNEGDRTLTKIDPRERRVVGTRGLPVSSPRDVGAAVGSVWVAAARRVGASYGPERQVAMLVQVDAASQAVLATEHVGLPADATAASAPLVVAQPGAVWLAHVGMLFRLNGETADIEATADVLKAVDLAGGDGAVWVVSRSGGGIEFEPTGMLQRVDAAYTTVEETIPLGGLPNAVAVGEGSVWVTRETDDALVRIDPVTNSTVATIRVGARPGDVAVGSGSVWVANVGDATVSRVDPETNEVVSTIHLGTAPDAIAAGNGVVWVTAY